MHSDASGTCSDCGMPLENHVCPMAVGTVRGTLVEGKIVKAKSTAGTCARCGLTHHHESGWRVVCTYTAACKWAGIDPKKAHRDVHTFEMIAEYLRCEASGSLGFASPRVTMTTPPPSSVTSSPPSEPWTPPVAGDIYMKETRAAAAPRKGKRTAAERAAIREKLAGVRR